MRKLIVIIVLFLAVSLFGLFYMWSNQPAKGTRPGAEDVGADVQGASTTYETFTSRLFTTKVSSNVKLKSKTELQNTPILGQYLFVDNNPYVSDQLAITVGRADSRDVSEVSPVQFRKTLPQEYEVIDVPTDYPEGSVMFIKKTGYERSIFWVDGDVYVGIVASGSVSRVTQLDQTLHAAVIHWR